MPKNHDQALITAFLYSGALGHPTHGTDFEDWEGHTGFVSYCATYAEKIADYINAPAQAGDRYAGSIFYELIEPMGEWLIAQPEPLDPVAALEAFIIEYQAWIEDPNAVRLHPFSVGAV